MSLDSGIQIDREGQEYSIDVWVNHMINFIEAIGEPKVSVIGNSFGGAIALHLVNRRPDLVNKVILMGSVGNKSTHFRWFGCGLGL